MNQPLTVTLARRAGGRVTAIALGAAFATLLAMPLLHLLPADSALHLSAYSLTLTGKILCYAIVRESEINQKGKARKLWDIEEGKGI